MKPAHYLLLISALLVLSAFGPADSLTWFAESVPVMIAVPLLFVTRNTFPLTPLLYLLLFLHGLVLLLGSFYTYAEVPLGQWLQELFGFERNHYDRLGHFMQGFTPAILVREWLLRLTPLQRGGWLFILVVCACLAFSAFYELIEWWAALALGSSADAFLGMQGDQWDTQWDMFLALCGALSAQLLLSRLHDRQLPAVQDGLDW
jgi:putative membrane protein